MHASLARLAALVVIFSATCASGAAAAGPDPIGPPSQSLADGCQRNIPGLLSYTSPEWVYVNRDPSGKIAEGTIDSSSPAADDLPEGHKSFDLNANVAVDPQYADLLAGDPARQTGNYAPGDESGHLHVEWETGTVPRFAWPTKGDRVKLWGSWIWDCGHWGLGFPDFFLPSQVDRHGVPVNGTITGERTEFHPMQALVVTRGNPSRPPMTQSQADVFISTDGTIAHAQEQCARDHPARIGSTSYGPDYTACVQLPASRQQTINDRDYSFFVPAPPKPVPGASLRYSVVDSLGGSSPQERVAVASNGINVTVPFTGSGSQAYGKTFYVGWSKADKNPPAHLRITYETVKVFNSLDPNLDDAGHQISTPPGEYNLYSDANGSWRFLNDSAPGLGATLDGQSFVLNAAQDVYVQAGKGLRLYFTGRECDFPGVDPCAATGELADGANDHPGDLTASYSSADAAIGTRTLTAPSGNWQITFSVARVP